MEFEEFKQLKKGTLLMAKVQKYKLTSTLNGGVEEVLTTKIFYIEKRRGNSYRAKVVGENFYDENVNTVTYYCPFRFNQVSIIDNDEERKTAIEALERKDTRINRERTAVERLTEELNRLYIDNAAGYNREYQAATGTITVNV